MCYAENSLRMRSRPLRQRVRVRISHVTDNRLVVAQVSRVSPFWFCGGVTHTLVWVHLRRLRVVGSCPCGTHACTKAVPSEPQGKCTNGSHVCGVAGTGSGQYYLSSWRVQTVSKLPMLYLLVCGVLHPSGEEA